MMRSIAILFGAVPCAVLCVALYGCSGRVDGKGPGTDRATDDVREAVFRYEFETNRSALGRNADFYFLAFAGDEDPPPAFMARFADHAPPVVPISEALIEPETGVRHRRSGGRGILFRVTSVSWPNDEVAVVQGGYYEGNLSAASGRYRVVWQAERWVVSQYGVRPLA